MQKICIIIPCYNEANRLQIDIFSKFIAQNSHVTFCFVNDGSSDNTFEILQQIKNNNPENIEILQLKVNSGKAEAVRQGMLHCCSTDSFEFIGYFDADLATPLSEISLLQEGFQRNSEIQFVFGSRIKRIGAIIERKKMRHLTGRLFATFASLILRLPIYDTQCGAKLFITSFTRDIFEKPFISKWLFDIEIFARILKIYGKEKTLRLIFEMPLNNWLERHGSKLQFSYLLKVPFELLKIKSAYGL